MEKLYRSLENRRLGGVCGGLGEYLNIDPVVVRLLFILFAFCGCASILAYIIMWIVVPEKPLTF
jgi:phage shock protein C